jgi:hypothetical protein
MEFGEKKYDKPRQPIGHDVIARHDDHSDTMVHVPSDLFRPVDAEQYYKGTIEKHIKTKYRRFSFSQPGIN